MFKCNIFLFLNNNYSVNESFDNFKGERWRSLKPWHKYVKLTLTLSPTIIFIIFYISTI